MEFELQQSIQVLARTPQVLRSLLAGLGPEWTDANEGPETWSPFDVLGHLIHGEQTDWLPRTRIILEHQTAQPFEPFDRFAQEETSRGKTLDELLDQFERLRGERLEELRSLELSRDDLVLCGAHPELGTVTLSELLAAWTVHDLGHIAQIARVMAKQYRNEIGPWPQYLPIVLDR